jgi:inosine-uridine nucleoside N-ribohydrolase
MQRAYVILMIVAVFACLFGIVNSYGQGVGNKLILETDMGNDVDDALALDMLYKYIESGRVDLLGVMINKNNKYAAEFIDIMGTWYGHSNVPVGVVKNGIADEQDAVNYAQVVSEMKNGGKPLFEHTWKDYELLPEAARLYREILAKQPDSSVTIVSVGFFVNLAQLLETKSDEFSSLNGRDLVARKVKLLTVMAGSFGENAIASYNIRKDIQSADKVFSEWPTRIVASPAEVGIQIKYPGASILTDFCWAKKHPLVEAYMAYLPMPYDRPTWDLTNVLYAVESENPHMEESAPGKIVVDCNGFTHFNEENDGKHSYLLVSKNEVEIIKEYFVKLITRKPLKYSSPDESKIKCKIK